MEYLLLIIIGPVFVWMISVIIRMIKAIIKGSLHGKCERGDIEGVKRHLADGADVNAKDDEKRLHWINFHQRNL